jgi:lysophospholipase L1-like esterase
VNVLKQLTAGRIAWGLLFACGVVPLLAQDASTADRNVVNSRFRPGDMMADSPVVFPKEGALPALYPPDTKTISRPAGDGYYLFTSPCRSVGQIRSIRGAMPEGSFSLAETDWMHLGRTRQILGDGGQLRILALGDSIVNDVMRSGWVGMLAESNPGVGVETWVYVRGGGGCQHYREEKRIEKYVVPLRPDLVLIGGISQRSVADIREVLRQLRDALPEVEVLLFTGAFGTADPRDSQALADASHSGTGRYGEALSALASQERCAYLDLTSPWAEYVKLSGQHPHVFYRDVVHANEYGEQILGRILERFFKGGGAVPIEARE